jgi:hypothetical protein
VPHKPYLSQCRELKGCNDYVAGGGGVGVAA